jgi:phosphate transport system substrate-binding protein
VTLTRFAAATLTLTAALALAACGSDPGAASPSTGDTTKAGDCPSGTLTAEGSSAQKNAIEQVIADYQDTCDGVTVDYNPSGSGSGIKQFNAGLVDFAGSDSALTSEEKDGVIETDAAKTRCQDNDAWNLPMVVGPIAVAFNVDGVKDLTLNAKTLAGIFSGSITKWNDPAIAATNKGASLPSAAIQVFFRNGESGTTENFTKYLQGSAGTAAWPKDPGKTWTGIGSGKEGSDQVAAAVKATANSITYVEWSYATDAGVSVAKIDNGAGPVELNGKSAGLAVAAAKPAGSGNDLKLQLDYATKTKGAYPIVLVTYEIACSKGLPADKSALVKSFLAFYAGKDEQQSLTDLGYAPLPEDVRAKVADAVDALQ